MAHIFFIDPIEKLNIKKDSTLMMALTFQQMGLESYILFEKDFFVTNSQTPKLGVYTFSGEFREKEFYLDQFVQKEKVMRLIDRQDIIHMRIDPPYDSRYQRYLWMLDFIQQQTGCTVLNDPLKIMKHNEKLVAYRSLEYSHPSFIGASELAFADFTQNLQRDGHKEIILKPLDLYSGIGVEKVKMEDAIAKFKLKVEEFQGAIVCQPFVKAVQEQGEYRAIYMDGKEMGTILKTPPQGDFLANIAQGARFEAAELPQNMKRVCDNIAKDLHEDGLRLLAFDILGDGINEVNITCPGLLVEVSHALNQNICRNLAAYF